MSRGVRVSVRWKCERVRVERCEFHVHLEGHRVYEKEDGVSECDKGDVCVCLCIHTSKSVSLKRGTESRGVKGGSGRRLDVPVF